jgi:hypothetical protein
MNGLRISRSPDSSAAFRTAPIGAGQVGSGATFVSAGLSDFGRYFAPLKSRFGRWRWVLHAEPHVFRFPDDWYDGDDQRLAGAEALVRAEHDDWRLVEGAYLEAVADTLLDDWCDFFALADGGARLDDFVERYWAAGSPAALEELLRRETVLHFSCVDGAVWEVHAADEALLGEVRAHLPAVRGAGWAPSTLMESLRRYEAHE